MRTNLIQFDDARPYTTQDLLELEVTYLKVVNDDLKIKLLARELIAEGKTFEAVEVILTHNLGYRPSSEVVTNLIRQAFKRRKTDLK